MSSYSPSDGEYDRMVDEFEETRIKARVLIC